MIKVIDVESLEESFDCWDLEIEDTHNFLIENCVVHNSNFTVSYDGTNIVYGKRSGPLEPGENFYNYKSLIPILEEIKDNYVNSKNFYNKITYYGEIFGPGVQKGVNYGKLGFRFFDILAEKGDLKYWINQDSLPLWQTENILLAPQLGSGTFDEVLNYNPIFDSKILNIENNPAEGVVLKPNIASFLPVTETRIILKNKHPKFSETAKGEPKVKIDYSLPDNVAQYISLNRLDNVLSKIPASFEKFNEIKDEFVNDILTELEKDGLTFDKNVLMKHCVPFIREEIKKKA
jgi:Rnl2 family RNA ligase